jgi:hypothetical protein
MCSAKDKNCPLIRVPSVSGWMNGLLTPTDVRRLIELKSASSLSGQTVRLTHALIRNALADAEREELIHRNVAKLVRPPIVNRVEVHASYRQPLGCTTWLHTAST